MILYCNIVIIQTIKLPINLIDIEEIIKMKNILYDLMRKNEILITFAYCFRDNKYKKMSLEQIENHIRHQYKKKMKTELDLVNPQTFTEKIQWLKLYGCTEEKTTLSDKYLVREWIKNTIGEEYLIPLIGAWDSFEEITFDKLPEKFCLKMNHGSSMNFVVLDKEKMNFSDAKNRFHLWEKRPFYAGTFETQYYGIQRKIIAEKYICEIDNNLFDYKFHCFDGKPMFIQCIGDRDLKAHKGYQNNFDLDWNKLDWTFEDYPSFIKEIHEPKNLEKMIELASKLSSGFNYVRVDLYNINGKIYFGEMTFTPASGIYPYRKSWTKALDKKLGDMLKLTDKKILFQIK